MENKKIFGWLALLILGVLFLNALGIFSIFGADSVSSYGTVSVSSDYKTLTYSGPSDPNRNPLPELMDNEHAYLNMQGGPGAFGASSSQYYAGESSLAVNKFILNANNINPNDFSMDFVRNYAELFVTPKSSSINEQYKSSLNALGYSIFNEVGCETGTNTHIYNPCYSHGDYSSTKMNDLASKMVCKAYGTITGTNNVDNNNYAETNIPYSIYGKVTYAGSGIGFKCTIDYSEIKKLTSATYIRFSGNVDFVIGNKLNAADLNADGKISFSELTSYANLWVAGSVSFSELINVANSWSSQ